MIYTFRRISFTDVIFGVHRKYYAWKQIIITLGTNLSNSVSHMMTGHAYSRALRAHFLTSSALVSFFINNLETDIYLNLVEITHKQMLTGNVNVSALEGNTTIHQIVTQINEIMALKLDDSRTI